MEGLVAKIRIIGEGPDLEGKLQMQIISFIYTCEIPAAGDYLDGSTKDEVKNVYLFLQWKPDARD